jgi:hypothetical protein
MAEQPVTTSSDQKSGPSLGAATGDSPRPAHRDRPTSRAPGRLPVPPRERRPALAALAVLLIVGGALVSAYLVTVSGQRVPVIRVARPVAAGQRIPLSALEEVRISATGGLDTIPWSDRDRVIQTYATVNLVQGALLTNGMIGTDASIAKGTVVVGLALKPGQLPAGGLRPGDRVALYAVAGANGQTGVPAGAVLAPVATVYDVVRPGRGDVESDQVQVSVAVPTGQASAVTQAASAGAVAVAILPAGESAPQPAPTTQPPASPHTRAPKGRP